MRKKKSICIAVIAAVLCFGAVMGSYAASYFRITDYDIKMKVNEDDTYDITETIDVCFLIPQHGIYRTIPYKTTLDRDGQKSVYRAKITNFKMLSGQQWEEEENRDHFSAKIGDPEEFAPENSTYSCSYTYDTRGDHFKGGDEVYMDLVGTAWEAASIDHVSFEITFPKDIDASKVGIKTGNNDYVQFESPDARTIKGETDLDTLGGLTIRAVLPEDYFTREAKDPVMLFYGLIVILAGLTAAGFVLWRKYGIDPVYPKTLEFDPPEGLSAPEVGFLSCGGISESDLISMLLSLADRGYIKIHEKEGKPGKRKKKAEDTYEFEMLKEYDGDIVGEKTFMDDLFRSGIRPVVQLEELENKFYVTLEAVCDEIRNKYEGKLYEAGATKAAKLMYAAGGIGFVILALLLKIVTGKGILYGGVIETIMMAGLPILGFSIVSLGLKNKMRPSTIWMSAITITIGLGIGWVNDMYYGSHVIPFFVGAALCFCLYIMGGLCEKKTEWYAQIRAKIDGYTDFLETAEKDKLEEIAEQDPEYFYRNLAFASALGITAIYASRFLPMAKEAPSWYDSYHYYPGYFDADHMTRSLDHMVSEVGSGISSSPSSGSGGGSFSGGGGGGGGGGGSW